MSQVITFVDYIPPARYDGVPWEQARVQEAAAASGPWTLIDTVDLDPVDADPTRPQPKSITTALASDDPGLWYRLVFVDYHFATSQPTEAIQNIEPSGRDYATVDEFKAMRTLQGKDYADAEIQRAITTASRVVDFLTSRRFYADPDANQVRYYTATASDHVDTDDIIEITELATDPRGTGVFDRVWVKDSDYVLTPLNAEADGQPYEEVRAAHRCRWLLPTWLVRGVRVTARFGWATVPAGATTATLIIAGRYVLRMRQAPFGIVTAGVDVGAVARIAAQDPEVKTALQPLCKAEAWIS